MTDLPVVSSRDNNTMSNFAIGGLVYLATCLHILGAKAGRDGLVVELP